VRENAFTHTPGLGVVWDPKHDVDPPIGKACHAILPTKTSLTYGWFACISCVFLKAGSQVSFTSFVNFLFCMIFDVDTLSMVRRSLIAWVHLALISLLVSTFSCMTLSHLRTHIRYADSDRRIWKSQVGPRWVILFSCHC